MATRLLYVTSLVPLFLLPTLPAAAAMPNCTVDAIAALNVPDVAVASATDVSAAGTTPEFCEVVGAIRTHGFGAPDGAAGYRVRLPVNWNGKFLFQGVGGLSGSFNSSTNGVDLALAMSRGYATAITDTGHQSALGATDASFGLKADGTPDRAKVFDYYFRATHQVTEASKQLVAAFFGSSIQRAYFDGCSNGGRQAMVEASRFPDDFDGIIAGAPFMDIRTIIAGVGFQKRQLQSIDTYIPAGKLAMIDQAAYASCDAADGVTDKLIQNPAKCAFDPHTLVTPSCTQSDPTCLTAAQADTLNTYFTALRDRRGGLIYTGSSITDLSGAGGMGLWSTGFVAPTDFAAKEPWGDSGFNPAPLSWQFVDHITQFFVERDPNFNTRDFGVNDGVVDDAALRLFVRRTELGDGDVPQFLAPFIARNKKLIMYHGFSDPALPPFRTVKYYEDLERLVPGSFDRLQRNVRLFMVPGMQHCAGGPGPNRFDTLTALENWVEHGAGPDTIVATKFVGDNSANGVARTMPLCKFPEEARYKGAGNVNDAANWICSEQDRRMLDVGPNGARAGLSEHRLSIDRSDKLHPAKVTIPD